METAQAIEAITDAGLFEILAVRVLRIVDRDFQMIEHLGVNAEGKTVKNPLDGFCMVPGNSPATYAMAAFSTDRKEKIERKLLFDHSTSVPRKPDKERKTRKLGEADDGDLVKAARAADMIRRKDASARFIFTFCTNKQPSEELMAAGYAAGEKIGVEVRFLARSRIRDCLDTTADGQWLRQEHLGIQAERLSLGYLQNISEASVTRYSNELFSAESDLIETRSTTLFRETARDRTGKLLLVTGESGRGKSVGCYQTLKGCVAGGGIGIWIPAQYVDRAEALEEALAQTLSSIQPNLAAGSGHEFLRFASDGSALAVVVIDDINRTRDPVRTLRKVLSWFKALTSTTDGNPKGTSPIQVLLPVWDRCLAPV